LNQFSAFVPVLNFKLNLPLGHPTQKRQEVILGLLTKNRKLTVPDLEQYLGVSPATIPRDLTELQKRGEVIRVHAGVMHPDIVPRRIAL